jgi:hypothetical protein
MKPKEKNFKERLDKIYNDEKYSESEKIWAMVTLYANTTLEENKNVREKLRKMYPKLWKDLNDK